MLESMVRVKLENVKKLIRRNAKATLEKLFDKLHPADIADIISNLSDFDRKKVWTYITDMKKAAEIILEMQDKDIAAIFKEIEPKKAADLIAEMDSDDASYVLRLVPEEKQQSLLQFVPKEDLEDVEELLHYPEDSAGAIMNTAFFSLPADTTVKAATKLLHKAEHLDMVYYLYVTDDDDRLAGVLSLRQLILNAPEKKLSEIMIKDVISVSVMDPENYAADLVDKYDLLALPVINENRRLCGIITVDDIIDVIKDRASEDIYTMAGVSQDEEMFDNQPFKVARTRLPWLLITFVGELFAGFVISYYQGKVHDFLIFATFMPIVMAMGGNVGSQSATIIIRGIALGNVNLNKVSSIIFKEMRVGAIMGLVIGILLGIVAPLWNGDPSIGLIVGTAIFFAMLFASFTGTVVPIILMKLRFDPAVASTPFISAFNDVTGLTIYFSVSLFMLSIL